MADKVTTMVLTVDLQCCSCTKKIKKVLAKFPEIRSQTYDEKKNTVTITVVCCSPENFRAKLCCKAGKTIKCIEIKEPVKGKTKPEPEKQEKPPSRKKVPDPAPPPCVPVHVYPNPVLVCCGPCCVGNPRGPCCVGNPRGPCFHGCGRPMPCCDGYGYGYGCGCNRRCYVSRCDEYFISEGNTSGCAIV